VSRVVVVGGGLAGLASAWALAGRGLSVTLVEREAAAGHHASGRNAGLVRRVVEDPVLAALGRRGAELLLAPPPDLSERPLYRRTGSTLLVHGADVAGLEAAAAEARANGVAIDVRPARELPPARLLGVEPARDALAVTTPDDGLAEPLAVVQALARACARRGVELQVGREVRLERAGPEGAVVLAPGASRSRLEADAVVLAAGAWSEELAGQVGAAAVPHASFRRNLTCTLAEPAGLAPAAAGWVWDLSRGFYLRPAGPGAGGPDVDAGLILCACDHEPRPPEDTRPAADAAARLAAALERVAPSLAHLPLGRTWAGLRTFTPDERFVVGRDPLAPSLVWASGLGGHGLTSALAVGELVARAVLDEADPLLAPLSPARFLTAEVA
jgi:glycine/D-amino acid oxidase-like deaminating enzyme